MRTTLSNAGLAAGFAAVLACAHSTGAAGGEGGPASGPVALRFAWPEGYQTHILIAHQSRRRGAEPTGILARQRLVTETKGTERWVSTRDTAARGTDPDLETTIKINEALIQVVAPDGRFIRAEGLDQAMAALKPSEVEDRENTRRALARSAASDWEQMVGAWAGQQLRPNDPQRKKVRSSIPLFAGVETTLDVEYGLEGRVPCTDEETARRCVAVTYRARIDPAERAATVERIRAMSHGKADEPVAEDVHGELETQVVTEADTLVPHRMTQSQRLRIRVRFPDGRVQESDERSEDVSLFTDRPPSEDTSPGQRPRSPPGPKRDGGQSL